MCSRIFTSIVLLYFFSVNAAANNFNNPFAKSESIDIGKSINWQIDKQTGQAIKSIADAKGTYYHLRFDNRRLELFISSDSAGLERKQFSQLEIKDVKIDGQQSGLFKWCLINQERHNRFLQQGLLVKNNICVTNGDEGSFMMQLNTETLESLKNGGHLLIMLKPYRTPVELHYDLADFGDMYLALNTKVVPQPEKVVATVETALVKQKARVTTKKTCMASPPAAYSGIKSIGYDCDNASAKLSAERKIDNLVAHQKQMEEKQRKLAEQQRQEELAAQLKQQEKLRAEAAAIAASEANQAKINNEITQKMIGVCEKYWSKGEHRCYCQKYIQHAPSEIQANASCQ